MIRSTQTLFLLTLLLLGSFITACNNEEASPTPVTASEVTYTTYENEELGVTLRHPEGWAVHNSPGGLTVATDLGIIEAESLSEIGEEGFVIIIPSELDLFNFQSGQTLSPEDPIEALNVYKGLLENSGQQFVALEPPAVFNAGDHIGAQTVLMSDEEGQDIVTIMAVLMTEDYLALISAASAEETAETLRPIFDTVIRSIQIGPPTA